MGKYSPVALAASFLARPSSDKRAAPQPTPGGPLRLMIQVSPPQVEEQRTEKRSERPKLATAKRVDGMWVEQIYELLWLSKVVGQLAAKAAIESLGAVEV